MTNNTYLKRGVSPTKEEVHDAIKAYGMGLYPGAFCKITEDFLGDSNYGNIMHADGAGTKSTIAYLAYKEFGDPRVFRGIAQDSVVMNFDDMLCVGVVNNFVISNTIGRNAHRIKGDVLREVIKGYEDFVKGLEKYGINSTMAGGETADLGDLVGTIIVDSTIFARIKRSDIVDCSTIEAGDVIIGLSSSGKASYEKQENSGIASNGFTAARHILLSKYYYNKYPETYSTTLKKEQAYVGPYKLEDKLPGSKQTVGEAILSPTRTYLPVVKDILAKHKKKIHGIINSSGGGQVKCKNFGKSLHYIKDNLFVPPPIFQAIEATGAMTKSEMYQVFNMGQRLEIYCDSKTAMDVIEISKSYNIDAQIIGRVESNKKSKQNKVTVTDSTGEVFTYE